MSDDDDDEMGGRLVLYATALDRLSLLPLGDALCVIAVYIDECGDPSMDYPPCCLEDEYIALPYPEPVGVV